MKENKREIKDSLHPEIIGLRKVAQNNDALSVSLCQFRRRVKMGIDPAKNVAELVSDLERDEENQQSLWNLQVQELITVQTARRVVWEMAKIQSWGNDELTKRLYSLRQDVRETDRLQDKLWHG
jgi:hypothetical protein